MNLLNLLSDVDSVQTYASGDWIFVEGQPGDVMYVVRSDRVDIVYEEEVIDSVAPGGILGELALIGNNIRSANAVAGNDCELISVDESLFRSLVQTNPDVAIEVMKVMADRLRRRTEDRLA